MEELKKKGLMRKSGLEAYDNRKESKSGIYSFEDQITKLADNFESIFKINKDAWDYFLKQAPSYQKTSYRWIMSAKQETTKISRLNKLIMASQNHERLF